MFSRLSSIWNRLTTPVEARSTSAWSRAWLAGHDSTLPGAAALNSPFTQSTWVYSCITALAENLSVIPFRILSGSEDNEQVLQDHPALTLFNNPHPLMDRFHFWELLVTWLCLRGEAFILPLLSPLPPVQDSSRSQIAKQKSKIKNLLILNPDHLREVVQDHQLLGWRYTPPGQNAPLASSLFLPEELVHIKLPNPFNFWRGLSPLTVAWLAAQTDYASSQFMKGTMLNNADTGLIVTTSEQLSDEQHQQIAAALRERKRAAGTPDKPLFLFAGAKVEKPTISAVDLQFLENRKFNRQEICAIFKVPQELLGFTEDANRSVADAARLNFIENRIAPLCRRLEAGVLPIIQRVSNLGGASYTSPTSTSVGATSPTSSRYNVGGTRYSESHSSTVRGEFHIKCLPVMQAAQRARVDTAAKLFSLGVPMNTVNRVLDLGLPLLPHGNTAWLPSILREIGSLDGQAHTGEEASTSSAPYLEPRSNDTPLATVDRCLHLLSSSA